MPKELGQPNIETPESSDLGTLELKANLSSHQREHLEVLKAKMKKILGDKTKQELAKAGDLVSLKNYRAVLVEILQFLKTKEIKDNKFLSFKTIEELEAVYSPEQIAHNKDTVGKDAKVYIGKLYSGIFNELPKDVEHLYTSFPEDKIVLKQITIGGKSVNDLKKELKEKGYGISRFITEDLLVKNDIKPLKKTESLELVILSVKDMGFPTHASRQEIYKKAQDLGLSIVPQEVGLQLRLQYGDQIKGEGLLIGSEPLMDRYIFEVEDFDDDGPELGINDGKPGFLWGNDTVWVFARPSSPEATADDGK